MPAPLILLPGTLCDEVLFAPQTTGLGDLAPVVVGDVSLDDSIVGMAERVLRSAPPRFSLAGLSMGGIVAMEVVRRAPDRVERLALLDTNPGADTPERRQARERQLACMRRHGLGRVMAEEIGPAYLARANSELLSVIAEMAERVGIDAFARQSHALSERRDQRDTLQRTRCPALVLCGALDRICPVAVHREMAGPLHDAELVVIQGAGHLPTLCQPDATTAALRRWLSR